MIAADIQAAVRLAKLDHLPPGAAHKLADYMALLEKWNAKMNLTAIHQPEQIVERHFLESIQCAQALPEVATLLDFGSGAGFPGVPIAILRPETRVTLGESQAKKASFLREVVRSLELRTLVYEGRIEEMDSRQQFEAVTMRAVDKMVESCAAAMERLKPHGWLILFATDSTVESLLKATQPIAWIDRIQITSLNEGFIMLGRKIH